MSEIREKRKRRKIKKGKSIKYGFTSICNSILNEKDEKRCKDCIYHYYLHILFTIFN
jgi:hypothetical protein